MENYYITNDNDIFVFFETISQTSPRSILDIGMFLKRIGAVSRAAMEAEISEAVRFDGMDKQNGMDIPVYSVIYDNIYDKEPSFRYDLAVFLRPGGVFLPEEIKEIISWTQNRARHLLMDDATYSQLKGQIKSRAYNLLTSENERYVLVHL